MMFNKLWEKNLSLKPEDYLKVWPGKNLEQIAVIKINLKNGQTIISSTLCCVKYREN